MNTNLKINPNFLLNGYQFDTIDALVNYSKQHLSPFFSELIEEWFDANSFITVQTSGSTSEPKLIQIKKEYVLNSIEATANYFNVFENTKALLCLPLQYIAGKLMLLRALQLGWHLDVVEPSSTPLHTINKTYDFVAMVPLQVENSIEKLPLVSKVLIGGAAISNRLEEKLQNVESQVFLSYGMTETITHIAIKKINHQKIQPTFFEVLPNISIFKTDEDCLVINAPKIADTPIFTNDVVRLISEKQFELLGRKDNVINSGGIKLHPEVIEKKLSNFIKYPFFVASQKDAILGEKLILVIENSTKVDINFSTSNLAVFEIPKAIYILETFVYTDTGKVQRANTLKKINFQ